jgi:hypothetical protein
MRSRDENQLQQSPGSQFARQHDDPDDRRGFSAIGFLFDDGFVSAARETVAQFGVGPVRVQAGQLEYQWNGLVVGSLEEIELRLRSILKVRADIPIIVDPEDTVLAGDALQVYDISKREGATSVYMVAR